MKLINYNRSPFKTVRTEEAIFRVTARELNRLGCRSVRDDGSPILDGWGFYPGVGHSVTLCWDQKLPGGSSLPCVIGSDMHSTTIDNMARCAEILISLVRQLSFSASSVGDPTDEMVIGHLIHFLDREKVGPRALQVVIGALLPELHGTGNGHFLLPGVAS